tara:strand:+ start:165 stop:338 length:174 start_codon:yes stop_codon:yes gene_type:complete
MDLGLLSLLWEVRKSWIIHNGEQMHIARNHSEAVSYIKKQISIEKKLKKKGSLEKFL